MGNEKTEAKENWPWQWKKDPVTLALPSWAAKVEKINDFLAQTGSGYKIDEIALQFESRHLYNVWLNEAVRGEGVEIFNAADDHVLTEPFGSEYDVQYTFLRMPAPMADVRLEAMFLTGGVSPLHVAQASSSHAVMDGRLPVVVHFSFKTDSLASYGLACAELEALGGVLGQACQSTYGRFSYFKFQHAMNREFAGIWLKPRVNMRDMNNTAPFISGAIKPGEVAEAVGRRSHLRALDQEGRES